MRSSRHPLAFPVLPLLLLLAAAAPARGAGPPERCLLQPVNGECKAMMEKYRYDLKSGRCVPYFYDGCGPVVPFETMEECRALCEPAVANPEEGVRQALEALAQEEAGRPAPAPREEGGRKFRPSGLAYDPVEDDPRHAEAFRTIDEEVKAAMAAEGDVQRRGSVHIYWSTKKGILKRKYGIDWRDPGEMNPHVIFD